MKVWATRYNLTHYLYKVIDRNFAPDVDSSFVNDLIFNNANYLQDYKLNQCLYLIEFLQDPENFLSKYCRQWKDTFSLYIEKNPSFHKDPDCKSVKSNFKNIVIPKRIRTNLQVVNDIRSAPKEILDPNKTEFITSNLCNLINKQYNIIPKLLPDEFDHIKFKAGIYDEIENSFNELVKRVEELHIETLEVFKKYPYLRDFKDIEYKLSKLEQLPYYSQYNYSLQSYLFNNIHHQLNYVRKKYINPITKRIKYYTLAKFNKEIIFDKSILETLGFKECKVCFH